MDDLTFSEKLEIASIIERALEDKELPSWAIDRTAVESALTKINAQINRGCKTCQNS